MRKKIGFLFANLNTGGAEILAYRIMHFLDRERFEPILLTMYDAGSIGENLVNEGYTVISHISKGKFDFLAGSKLHKILTNQEIKTVITIDSAAPLFWASQVRTRMPELRLFVSLHSFFSPNSSRSLRSAFAKAKPIVDKFIALTSTHRDFFMKELGLNQDRFDIIFSGVDIDRFHPSADKSVDKQKMGIPADVIAVGIIARLRVEKNHALFIASAKEICGKNDNVRFYIVGGGDERATLVELVQRLNLQDKVLFMGNRDDTDDWYRALDIKVLCSTFEALPVTLMEASASGIPVICTNVGSVRDLVDDGQTGFIIDSGGQDALVEKLTLLINNLETRESMGTKGRTKAVELFSEQNMIDRYETLLL